jgi:hypothetical protein
MAETRPSSGIEHEEQPGRPLLLRVTANGQPFGSWELGRPHGQPRRVVDPLPPAPRAEPDGPTVPDRFGRFREVARTIEKLTGGALCELVVDDFGSLPADGCALVSYVQRRLGLTPLEYGVDPASSSDVATHVEEASEVETALLRCRSGAIVAGERDLVGLLRQSSEGYAAGWHMMAMIGLATHRDDLVSVAVAQATRHGSARQQATATRTLLLSVRRRMKGNRTEAEVRSISDWLITEGVPLEWVLLDRALVETLHGTVGNEVAALDRLLGLTSEGLSPTCRSTALVWRGAASFLAGDMQSATELQREALEVLDELGEVTRAQHVAHRVGLLEAMSGRVSAALEMLGRAADLAQEIGDMEGQISCIADGAELEVLARPGVVRATHLRTPFWPAGLNGVARIEAMRLEVASSLLEGDPERARIVVRMLRAAVQRDEEISRAYQVRATCHAMFLSAAVARALGEEVRPWKQMGTRLVELGHPSDAVWLRYIGSLGARI